MRTSISSPTRRRRNLSAASSSTPTKCIHSLDNVETLLPPGTKCNANKSKNIPFQTTITLSHSTSSSSLKGRLTAHRPQRFWFVSRFRYMKIPVPILIASLLLVSLVLIQCKNLGNILHLTSDGARGINVVHLKQDINVFAKDDIDIRTHASTTRTTRTVRNNKQPVVFFTVDPWRRDGNNSSFQRDDILSVSSGEESPSQPEIPPNEEHRYSPMQPWQIESFPTCNLIHEINLQDSGNQNKSVTAHHNFDQRALLAKSKNKVLGPHSNTSTKSKMASYLNDNLSILGRGWFRHTWKFAAGASLEAAVIKTLRIERDYTHEFYELHRRDAVAMERLTKSPYIVNIFGSCGPSVINEFADFVEGFHNFRDFAKQMRNKDSDEILRLKLNIAAMIAMGVQDIHEIDGIGNATMVHYDINPMNVAITFGGIPKLNDFNVAEFIQWDNVKNKRTPFVGRLKEPWWRAPEEMQDNSLLDEKVDIYSLGNIFYYLLTGHSPRGAINKARFDEVRNNVRNGVSPNIPSKYKASTNPAINALVVAIGQCFIVDPRERLSARDIASDLLGALSQIEKKS